MPVDPNLLVDITVDRSWTVELSSPRPNDPEAGWYLTVAKGDYVNEIILSFADWSERDIEAWLLRAWRQVNHYRDSDRGGPTPETVRHANARAAALEEQK